MTAFPEPAKIEHVFGEPLRGAASAVPEAPAAACHWRVVDTDGSVRASVPQTPGSPGETPAQGCAGRTTGARAAPGRGAEPARAEQAANIEALAQQLAQAPGPIDMPSPNPKLDVGQPVRAAARSAMLGTGPPACLAAGQSAKRARASIRPGAARVVETRSSCAHGGADLDSLLSSCPPQPASLGPRGATPGRKQPYSATPSLSPTPSPVLRTGISPSPSLAAGRSVCASGSGRQETDPALARLIERWAALPRGVRAAVVAMVEAGAKD